MNQDEKERYVRWQDYRITQVSYAINLFLGFAVASLAYGINLKLGPNGRDVISLETVIIWWSFSGAFGCLATISKLLDYRHTARKIKDGGVFNDFMAHWCGPVTWVSFWVQVVTYGVGASLFIRSAVSF